MIYVMSLCCQRFWSNLHLYFLFLDVSLIKHQQQVWPIQDLPGCINWSPIHCFLPLLCFWPSLKVLQPSMIKTLIAIDQCLMVINVYFTSLLCENHWSIRSIRVFVSPVWLLFWEHFPYKYFKLTIFLFTG